MGKEAFHEPPLLGDIFAQSVPCFNKPVNLTGAGRGVPRSHCLRWRDGARESFGVAEGRGASFVAKLGGNSLTAAPQ